jgi:hypothetical protein
MILGNLPVEYGGVRALRHDRFRSAGIRQQYQMVTGESTIGTEHFTKFEGNIYITLNAICDHFTSRGNLKTSPLKKFEQDDFRMTADTIIQERRNGPINGAGIDPLFRDQSTKGSSNLTASATDENIEKARLEQNPGSIPYANSANSTLVHVWRAAAQQRQAEDHLTVVHQQQEQQAQEQTEAKERKDEEDWLKNMSPEYQEAYNNFLSDLNQADQEDDEWLAKLEKQRQSIERQIQEQDEKAIKLSGGRNAYLDKDGAYRYGDGQKVEGQDLKDAEKYHHQHPEANTSYEEHDAAAKRRQQTIDAEKGLNDDKTQNAAARTNAKDGNLTGEKQVADAKKTSHAQHEKHLEAAEQASALSSQTPSSTPTSVFTANAATYQRHSHLSHASTLSESPINAPSASSSFNASASPPVNNSRTLSPAGPTISNVSSNSNPSVKQIVAAP